MKNIFHIIIGFFFSLLVAVLVAHNNINLFMGDADDVRKATVYFKQSVLDSEVDKFISEKIKGAEKIKKISKEEALAEFKSTFGDFAKNLSDLDSTMDLIPFSLEIIFKDSASRNRFSSVEMTNELVDEIVAVDQIFSRYKVLQRSLSTFILALFSTGFLLTALMTSLLIRNMIYMDQRRIEIYALFGQSYQSVVGSYFKKFLTYYCVTLLFSFVFVYVVFGFFKFKLGSSPELQFISDRLNFLSISQILILGLGFFLSYFSGLYFVLKQSLLKVFNR